MPHSDATLAAPIAIRRTLRLAALPIFLWVTNAAAQEPALPSDPPPATPAPAPQQQPASNSAVEVVPAKDAERHVSLEPKVAEAPLPGRAMLQVDPIADGVIIGISLGTAALLDQINSTGEILPQRIEPGFDRNRLLGIDRWVLKRTPNANAGMYSNLGLGAAVAFAFIDPVVSGFREHNVQTGFTDAVMYAESISLAYALTNVVKVAVRRPRPLAYIDADAHKDDPNYSNTGTDSTLSFFSGHSAVTAAVGATATYLAFTRSPRTARPWITLVLATGLSTFVSLERVLGAKHFPTDVIAASFAGAGIGVIVPHLHRVEDVRQRRVWVGFAPIEERQGARGGLMNVSGVF